MAGLTVKLCATCEAAELELLPARLASMVQVPAAPNVAVVPETVQTLGVVEVKETARPEFSVTENASGAPTVCVPGLSKVMVCTV